LVVPHNRVAPPDCLEVWRWVTPQRADHHGNECSGKIVWIGSVLTAVTRRFTLSYDPAVSS
jgi:hypothetical protein